MRIRDILGKIDEHHLFVPAFQREYVWKKKDAKNLIGSLIQDYPTGTMLTWETTNPPELKGEYVYESTKGAVKLILDGQQRITTLYLLMTGNIPPYYLEKEIKHDIRGLHVNVETLSLEYYKKPTMENDPAWIDITEIFKGNIRTRDIVDKLEMINDGERIDRNRENNIDDNIEAIKRIQEREFLEQVIPAKATIKEAIDIFYIVNSSGVNLTDAELALAQISGYWPKAREEFKEKLDELKSKGWVFKLDFIIYVLLAVIHHNGSKMEKLHAADNKDEIKSAWKKLKEQVLDYTLNLLQSQAYIDHTDEINSVYALIPIITYTFNKPNGKLNEGEIKRVIRWFYFSQIRNRYSSQIPQKLDKDIGIVFRSSTPFDELLAMIEEERDLEIKPSEFVGRDIKHPLFSLMRWYFKSVGAVCLGTGIQLRKNMGSKYELERDHIFAYSVLRDSEHFDMEDRFNYALAHEITNRAILTETENRSKSAKLAENYLESVANNFPNALVLQCIPEDKELWKIENFDKFLKKRRALLAEKLNQFLSNISYLPDHVSAEIDINDLIQDGEHDFLEFKSTLRWNLRENIVDKRMEDVILKTVAGFSNSEGGKLLIGVADDGELLGLENDYNTLKESNRDQFELHLRNLLNQAFGKEVPILGLKIRFHEIDDVEICEIDIKAGSKPIFIDTVEKNGQKQKKFFVRSGNSSQHLDIHEVSSYIQKRFN